MSTALQAKLPLRSFTQMHFARAIPKPFPITAHACGDVTISVEVPDATEYRILLGGENVCSVTRYQFSVTQWTNWKVKLTADS